mmetsp:Transcript_31573/g.100674  ORF Transcript_31573/g.100674 Transcript_31573/m.100674 type:complete len:222 (+) Transcript_31573:1715-2380(+)
MNTRRRRRRSPHPHLLRMRPRRRPRRGLRRRSRRGPTVEPKREWPRRRRSYQPPQRRKTDRRVSSLWHSWQGCRRCSARRESLCTTASTMRHPSSASSLRPMRSAWVRPTSRSRSHAACQSSRQPGSSRAASTTRTSPSTQRTWPPLGANTCAPFVRAAGTTRPCPASCCSSSWRCQPGVTTAKARGTSGHGCLGPSGARCRTGATPGFRASGTCPRATGL